MSAISDRVRIEWAASDKARDEGLTTPEDVVRFDNIKYSSDPEWNLLDIYLPKMKAPSSGYPVVINFHGGGYIYGSKDIYQFYGLSISQRGFAFINPSYRLAPEHMFPAALVDMNEVVKFIIANAPKYNLDLNNIFLVGDSAGGHYAALYACLCTNKAYADSLGIKIPVISSSAFVPNAIALNCGIYDPIYGIENEPDRDEYTTDVFGPDWKKTYAPKACTPQLITKDYPPSFIMTGSNDFLQPQLPLMTNRFDALGIPYVSKLYGAPGEEEYYHVFHVNMRHPYSSIVNDDECTFFKTHMR